MSRDDRQHANHPTDDQQFWTRYSPRYEMPISYTASALVIALLAGLLALVLMVPVFSRPKPAAQIGYIGEDMVGAGSEGATGAAEPNAANNPEPKPDPIREVEPNPVEKLPPVKDEPARDIVTEPNADTPKPDAARKLNDAIQSRLDGNQKGGSAGNDKAGTGPGGPGADSTAARSLRWVITFKTRDGRDYLSQLSALGAVVVVPIPPDSREQYIFRDLTDPKKRAKCTAKDWDQLTTLVQFTDTKRQSVDDVSVALGLDFIPKNFMAFFPKELEDRLSRMEKGHANRRAEDIEETRFEMLMKDGKCEIKVVEQKLKK